MKIGELAKRSDTPASTIRYYEQQGLLPKTQRSSNGYRAYDESALERLQLIKFSQQLGFKLSELPTLLDNQGQWDHQVLTDRIKAKQEEIDTLMGHLLKKQQALNTLLQTLNLHWHSGKCLPTDELEKIMDNATF